MTERIVALLPMRHDSERVPGKNYRPFAGRPLFEHVLSTLLSCERIAEVLIDTDSPTVRGAVVGRERVRLIERPEHLRGGEVPMNDILLHDAELTDAEFLLQTHSTNPLLTVETVDLALTTFLAEQEEHDSLFTVTRLQTRLWDHRSRPLNHDPDRLERTQDLPPVYEENSCLYLFTKQNLVTRGNRIGERPRLLEIPPLEAVDIDTEWDFRLAEVLFEERQRFEDGQ